MKVFLNELYKIICSPFALFRLAVAVVILAAVVLADACTMGGGCPGVRVSIWHTSNITGTAGGSREATRHGGRPWQKFCAVPQGSNIMRDDTPGRQNASHGFFGAKTVTWFFGYRENR